MQPRQQTGKQGTGEREVATGSMRISGAVEPLMKDALYYGASSSSLYLCTVYDPTLHPPCHSIITIHSLQGI